MKKEPLLGGSSRGAPTGRAGKRWREEILPLEHYSGSGEEFSREPIGASGKKSQAEQRGEDR